jgi:signal transduction histidine kinase
MPRGRLAGTIRAPIEELTVSRGLESQAPAAPEVELRRLVAEQAALRRVATFVAGEPAPDEVFQLVTEEVCALLQLRSALLVRYEGGEALTIAGAFGAPPDDFPVGGRMPLEAGAARAVLRTGRPARVDYRTLPGRLAARMLANGFVASVAAPITVSGTLWGALVAGLREHEPVPAELERRMGAFAELAALAVASAHARDELAASRLRIVEASDAARRRIERNLHDGAQQRLVGLALRLRLARAQLQRAPAEAAELLVGAEAELAGALDELRELAHGIHPPLLSERGLAAALEALAHRAPLPVDLDVALPARLPEPLETAAYYVVSESLANVAKHAGASGVVVRVAAADGVALVEICDDGAGGADPDLGSGLCGLRDRVETLDGTFAIESAPGGGTVVRAALPLPATGRERPARRPRS